MRIFISGPMSGYENDNKEMFDSAEKLLTELGYSAFNPSCIRFGEEWTRNDKSAIDIAILSRCDGILLLPGWKDSVGATVEYSYALGCGKKILDWEEMWS